ncbi:MAG TPA: hypothetical protein VJ718_03875 [Candidatus Binataceae bacterium]|nr:hypothetical protein [Candidatus Binataceae bacterium]
MIGRFTLGRGRLLAPTGAAVLLALASGLGVSHAFEIKDAGKLSVGRDTPLVAFSTDPSFQQVLSDDFSAAKRNPSSVAGRVLTVTVTVSERPLKPGVSLNDVAPGDPQVADLIKAAGAMPPPIGDTGNEFDQAAFARQMAARNRMPSDTPMEQMIQQLGSGYDTGMMGPPMPCVSRSVITPGCPPPPPDEKPDPQPGNPGYTGDIKAYMRQGRSFPGSGGHADDRGYDRVIVARAAVTGQSEEMTVVSVIHSGDDAHEVKKLMAEKIADSLLH